MNWPNVIIKPKSWEEMSQDDLLVEWDRLKKLVETAKENEMELRKFIVKRAFPTPKEGVNKQELGNGYELKAQVKFNYNLKASNEKIEETLTAISKIGNRGNIVAERLISWKPTFLKTEWNILQEDAKDGSEEAKQILALVNDILEITNGAPTLEIREPKAKK